MKLLTVSVAAYNVDSYLRQALDSCIIPEIMDKLEVLIVNDGSSDDTPNIAQEYVEQYPKTFFLINKENGGYGSTINLAINKAKGKYFKQLDGDDWFHQIGLLTLMNELEYSDADVVISPFRIGSDIVSMEGVPINQRNYNKDMLIRNVDFDEVYGMWHITYKTKLLRKSGLRLPEHRLYTDQLFATIPFAYAQTIRFINEAVYCYRIGRNGQSVSRESRIKHCQDALDNCTTLVEFYENQKNQGIKNQYLVERISLYFNAAVRTILLDKVNRKNYRRAKNYNYKIKCLSDDIYNAAKKKEKSRLLWMIRKTYFTGYYLIKFIPGGVPNWM